MREGARGVGRAGWVRRGEQSYRGLWASGVPSNVEELDVVLENSSSLGLEVGVENRDLRQRAGSQSGNARGTDLSVLQHSLCAMPTLLATVPPRFKHHLTICLRARATVRCVWMQMGGGAMTHVHAAGGAAHRNFRTPGGRPGSLGRCPLTELGRDPVRRHGRPSRPLLRA